MQRQKLIMQEEQFWHVLWIHNLVRDFAFATDVVEFYLSDRLQFISVDAIKSNPLRVRSGVPHGSINGPLLLCGFYLKGVLIIWKDTKLRLTIIWTVAPVRRIWMSLR
ncbi:uncharacterized protein LOC119641676 [Glossina fuscipes]|uniref:Uncharacterized protein LOC119641676 n=1 Tax=Glossina fuscipes TaxID=7396 RepID=A0A9C6DNN7_9MUSC|nr:uncharacterized protein LOC119641676 [Glossina fuscipes]